MSRASLVLLLVCFLCVTELRSAYLIKARSFDTILTLEVPEDAVNDNKLTLQQETPAGLPGITDITVNKKCAEVGEFCMNNEDCCSHSCLGFLKRCVSSF